MRKLLGVTVIACAGLVGPIINWIGVTHDSVFVDFVSVSWPFLIFGPYESGLPSVLIRILLTVPNVILYGACGIGIVMAKSLLGKVLSAALLLLTFAFWGFVVVDSWQGVLLTWTLIAISVRISMFVSRPETDYDRRNVDTE